MPDAGVGYGAGTTSFETPGEAAAAFARAGFRVFPCNPDKRPLVRWKEQATVDLETIAKWWNQWPDAMIGLPRARFFDALEGRGYEPHRRNTGRGYLGLRVRRHDYSDAHWNQ